MRDGALDEIAARHADAMRKLKRIAHDAGDGDPQSRVQASGLNVLAAGENVAHALDITRAHRALWASPSHRENLLQARFDRIGIGLARIRMGRSGLRGLGGLPRSDPLSALTHRPGPCAKITASNAHSGRLLSVAVLSHREKVSACSRSLRYCTRGGGP